MTMNAATQAKPATAQPVTTLIEPYLFFNGSCEEAMRFYEKALGAKVEMLMRVKDSPDPPPPGMYPPGSEDKIMHASLEIGGARIMASDGCDMSGPAFKGFSLSLTARDEAQARRWFEALGDGGQVGMPLGKTFFSPCFGMVTDRFGVGWMVIVQ
jgi:PhnB protein